MKTPRDYFTLHVDPVGTVADLVWDEPGQEVWRREGDAWSWGSETHQVGAIDEVPFRFPGQLWDPETGLHYNRMRYYVPHLGRYSTPDPVRFNGGSNLYWYAPDPVNWIDPSGLQLTIFGHSINRIDQMDVGPPPTHNTKKANVYRVDCMDYKKGPPKVCTSSKGPPKQRPLLESRAGGNREHNRCVMDLAHQFMSTEPGFALLGMGINQAQVGYVANVLEKVGRNRPDAFGGGAGTNIYGECDHVAANAEAHAKTICENDPGGIVYLAVIP